MGLIYTFPFLVATRGFNLTSRDPTQIPNHGKHISLFAIYATVLQRYICQTINCGMRQHYLVDEFLANPLLRAHRVNLEDLSYVTSLTSYPFPTHFLLPLNLCMYMLRVKHKPDMIPYYAESYRLFLPTLGFDETNVVFNITLCNSRLFGLLVFPFGGISFRREMKMDRQGVDWFVLIAKCDDRMIEKEFRGERN